MAMEDLSEVFPRLRQAWERLDAGPLTISTEAPPRTENSAATAVPIICRGAISAWFVAAPPPPKQALAEAFLDSWVCLLEIIAEKNEVAEGLTEKLILAWNRLNFLHQTAELMLSSTDPQSLALKALPFAMDVIEAENAFVAQLFANGQLTFNWVNHAYTEHETRQIVTALHQSPELLILNKKACRKTFPELTNLCSFLGEQLSVTVASPIFVGLTNQTTRQSFDAGDIQIFESLVEELSVAAEINALHRQQIEAEQLKRDLEFAAEVQNSFLPANLPVLADYDLAATLISASEIGGDFYDVCHNPNKIGFLVCDVAGKGISAALLAADLRARIKIELEAANNPGQTLQRANTRLYEDMLHVDRFATAALLCLPRDSATLHYASAGHTTSLMIQANPLQVRELPSLTLPLGVLPDIEDSIVSINPEAGDVLVIYSDGLIEAEDDQGQTFGLEGITRVLLATHTAPAQFIRDSLVEASAAHRGDSPSVDDLTVLVIKKQSSEVVPADYLARLQWQGGLSVLAEIEKELMQLKPHLPATKWAAMWLMEVQLAMSEAVSNIIIHAYAEQPGAIHGLIALYGDRLEIDLVDTGLVYEASEIEIPELNPEELREGGYGLPIIHATMDTVVYQRLPGGYNHWRYSRALPV